MEQNDLLVEMIANMRSDLNTFRLENNDCHEKIIARQDIQNGSLAKMKVQWLILKVITCTIFVVLAILGFMPQRIYDILSGMF
jgi:hypothetical protein